jgi:hypothetical protein
MAKDTKETFSGKLKDQTFEVLMRRYLPGAENNSVTTMLKGSGGTNYQC